jgi:hypothetical protein
MVKITDKQKNILSYLKKNEGNWVSPTTIGMTVFGKSYNNASGYTSPTLLKMVEKDLIVRNSKGHYKYEIYKPKSKSKIRKG